MTAFIDVGLALAWAVVPWTVPEHPTRLQVIGIWAVGVGIMVFIRVAQQ